MWDPVRLERIVYNLLGNALKYSPHGGSVTIAVRVESGFAVLEVSDEGIGIPSADVGRRLSTCSIAAATSRVWRRAPDWAWPV